VSQRWGRIVSVTSIFSQTGSDIFLIAGTLYPFGSLTLGFVTPKGFSGTWDVIAPIKKHFTWYGSGE
jgi:uncharacterized cupin superfamily protein